MDALTMGLAVAVVVVFLVLRVRRAVLYHRRANRVIARWVEDVRQGEAMALHSFPLHRVGDVRWQAADFLDHEHHDPR
ncbi:hypothetical protein AB0A74_01330 [Saccharothrix sp. NPDC042600]|uniref:hypothetical protein n=1 Tax=Saccharothrix TaxID=2071 RepID=UPI003406331B|nr:hypothetical protein GCM10017745_49750 [Saccharothrix mutabilis subsp. capreolus]